MKQLKKKKGFTLVELIVVIAIIAILAAVAVPTTMHFVEQAHESNDQARINILQNLTGYFTPVATGTVADFDITTAGADNKLAKSITEDPGTLAARKAIKTIVFTISKKQTDDTVSVTATITSKGKEAAGSGCEAKKPQTVEGTVCEAVLLTDLGASAAAEGTYTFTFDTNGVASKS